MGSGIKRIFNAAKEYGLPEPRVQEFDNMFRIELFRNGSLVDLEMVDSAFKIKLEEGKLEVKKFGENSEKVRKRFRVMN